MSESISFDFNIYFQCFISVFNILNKKIIEATLRLAIQDNCNRTADLITSRPNHNYAACDRMAACIAPRGPINCPWSIIITADVLDGVINYIRHCDVSHYIRKNLDAFRIFFQRRSTGINLLDGDIFEGCKANF